MPESVSFFSFLSFHHLSYCMGHRFQARQHTIETGREGVFCGITANNLYPRSCIELWAWVIISTHDSGWEAWISAVDISNCIRRFPVGLSFSFVMSKCRRTTGAGYRYHGSHTRFGGRDFDVWKSLFFCCFGLLGGQVMGSGLESLYSTRGWKGRLRVSWVICMDASNGTGRRVVFSECNKKHVWLGHEQSWS